MKIIITFLAVASYVGGKTADAFSVMRIPPTRAGVSSCSTSTTTALSGNMLDSLVPHNDVVGRQGGGNLVEDHGWANVQGGSIVDWSVGTPGPTPPSDSVAAGAAAAAQQEGGGALAAAGEEAIPSGGVTGDVHIPLLNDVVGDQGRVVSATKQNDWTVQGGSVNDWSDKQFMKENS